MIEIIPTVVPNSLVDVEVVAERASVFARALHVEKRGSFRSRPRHAGGHAA